MKKFIQKELLDYKLLLRSIPSMVVTFFIVSVILMNLLANKEITTNIDWLVIDCGLLISWVTFLTMDMVTKHFGCKASIRLSFLAIVINLLVCLILFGISLLPGNWSAYYTFNNTAINIALNNTFGGTWFVVVGSMIAFGCSAIVNSVLNTFIGRRTNNTYKGYVIRTYISTLVGQFVDNLVFALLISHTFFGWSFLQCCICSLTGCLLEFIGEAAFTPFSYKICNQWEIDNVGKDYIERCIK